MLQLCSPEQAFAMFLRRLRSHGTSPKAATSHVRLQPILRTSFHSTTPASSVGKVGRRQHHSRPSRNFNHASETDQGSFTPKLQGRTRYAHFGDRTCRCPSLINFVFLIVYIGKTASLSFLQFLRHTIRQQMGPSVFTENTQRHLMLEINSPEDGSSHFAEDDQHKRTLVEAYHASVSLSDSRHSKSDSKRQTGSWTFTHVTKSIPISTQSVRQMIIKAILPLLWT